MASRRVYSPRSTASGTAASSGATAATASAFSQGVSQPPATARWMARSRAGGAESISSRSAAGPRSTRKSSGSSPAGRALCWHPGTARRRLRRGSRTKRARRPASCTPHRWPGRRSRLPRPQGIDGVLPECWSFGPSYSGLRRKAPKPSTPFGVYQSAIASSKTIGPKK